VTHPAFLVGDVGMMEDPDLPYADTVELPDEPLATKPDGREHLGVDTDGSSDQTPQKSRGFGPE